MTLILIIYSQKEKQMSVVLELNKILTLKFWFNNRCTIIIFIFAQYHQQHPVNSLHELYCYGKLVHCYHNIFLLKNLCKKNKE